jgi:hypothetical protein
MVNKELVYFMTVEFQDEQYAVGWKKKNYIWL